VYLVDRERRILLWNDGAENITGYRRQEVIGRSCFDNLLMHCDQHSTLLCGLACPLLETIHDGKPCHADVFLRHKDGQRIPVRIRAVPIRDSNGSIIGASESFDERVLLPEGDIHPNNRAVDDHADGLTGILDHHSIQSHLSASLLDFTEYHVPFCVLAVAIDKPNEFQDAHGRKAMEAMVSVVARTLSRNLHPDDRIGRWSESRFLVIVMNCPASGLAKLAEMLSRIVGLAEIPWWGDRISVTVSMGATSARPDDSSELLLERAERALNAGLLEGNRVQIV
jgi:diguanylate cyclase (GGDEF)-like protein/PAS domain S-box-containing protein